MTLTKLLKTITPKEWRLVFFISFILAVITTVPLFYGWLNTPEGHTFTGIHFTAYDDWLVYYSYFEQVRQGNWLFYDLFTTEVHAPVLHLEWLAIGLIAQFFHLSNLVVFNLVRVLLIPLLFGVIYVFIAYIFPETKKRLLALWLMAFSSGLGVFLIKRLLLYPFNFADGRFNWPMDWWVPESNTFLTVYYSPHHIISLIFILLTLFLTALAAETKMFRYSIGAAVTASLVFYYHPYHILSLLAVIFLYSFIMILRFRARPFEVWRHFLLILTFSLPAVIYFYLLLQFDFVMMIKSLQNLTPTPPIYLTLISYGLLLIFASVGIYKQGQTGNNDHKLWLLLVWLVTGLVLIYVPVNYQRRMSAGLHFPLVIFATLGLFYSYQLLKERNWPLTRWLFQLRYFLFLLLILLFTSSSLFVIAADFFVYSSKFYLAYIDNNIIQAATWFKTADSNATVLNWDNNVINLIPTFSARRVYIGHGVETVNIGVKRQAVKWFFAENHEPALEYNFLKKQGIDYIFFGPAEKALGRYAPDTKSYLRQVYSNQTVKIYQVL